MPGAGRGPSQPGGHPRAPPWRSGQVRAQAAAHLCAHLPRQVCVQAASWPGRAVPVLCRHTQWAPQQAHLRPPPLAAGTGEASLLQVRGGASPAPLEEGGQGAAPGCGQGLQTQGWSTCPRSRWGHPMAGQLSPSWVGGQALSGQQGQTPRERLGMAVGTASTGSRTHGGWGWPGRATPEGTGRWGRGPPVGLGAHLRGRHIPGPLDAGGTVES